MMLCLPDWACCGKEADSLYLVMLCDDQPYGVERSAARHAAGPGGTGEGLTALRPAPAVPAPAAWWGALGGNARPALPLHPGPRDAPRSPADSGRLPLGRAGLDQQDTGKRQSL